MSWIYDDGGRSAAGVKGPSRDCSVRALAIAAQIPYLEALETLSDRQAAWAESSRSRKARQTRGQRDSSALRGVWSEVMRLVMSDLGWCWTPTMLIGSGCRVHLTPEELPPGRLICSVSRHYVAVIDGVVRDTHDPRRSGTRAVYGYWQPPADDPGSFVS